MRTIAFIIAICLFNQNCKKSNDDEYICDTPIVGSYIVNTNYPDWHNSSCFYTITNGKINLSFNSLDDLCNLDQFGVVSIDKSIGEALKLHSEVTNPIKDGFTLLYELTGEDGVIGSYNLDHNYFNKLTILSINNDTEEIKGSFDLQFIPDSIHIPNFNEIVYFKNGTFTAKLVK